MVSRVLIHSDLLSSESIAASLSLTAGGDFRVMIERTRSVEAAVLVAMVGAGGTALGALITGILKLANERGALRVVVQGSSGRRIEIPAGLPEAEVTKLIALSKEIDVDKITF
jgi:hypothetical protein